MSLLRPARSWEKEDKLSLDNPEQIFEFESVWHPEYQRYSEHVFNHLINVPLYMLGRLNRKPKAKKPKDFVSQTLANRVETLKDKKLTSLTDGFEPIVRNAISHGGVDFGLVEITYIDKRKNAQKVLSAYEFSQLFDDMVDTCHSILIAMLLFVCNHRPLVQTHGLHRLPLGLRFLFIDAIASTTRFQLLTMIESRAVIGNRRQLNISCRIDTCSRLTHTYEAIAACWHSASFGGEDYERFAVSIDCGRLVTSSLFVDGDVLHQAISKNWTIDQCREAKLVETDLLWFDVPTLQRKMNSWRNLFLARWELCKRQVIQQWRQGGFKMLGSRYSIRHIIDKSAEKIRRIEAYVVLHETGTITDAEIHSIIRHIVKRLRKHRIKGKRLDREIGFSRKPNYIWIRLYAADRRLRRFSGWHDGNLILMAEWFSRWKNNGPIFVKSPHQEISEIRIRYNPELTIDEDGNPAFTVA